MSKPMNSHIVELDCMATVKLHAPLWNSPHNQLRRALGKFTVVYCGGVEGGTVRDADGKCWDWWPTEERLDDTFSKIKIVPAV